MLQRAISGVIFVILLLLSVLFFEGYLLLVLFTLFTFIGTWEYFSINRKNSDIVPHKYYGVFLSCIVYLALTFSGIGLLVDFYLWLMLPLYFIPFLIELYKKSKNPFNNVLHTLAPIFYIAIPFALLVRLGFLVGEYDYTLILSFLLMQWANDTGAYLSGKFLGKRKLFERISPNKTWEGAMGGVVLTIIVSILCFNFFNSFSVFIFVGMALIISVIGSMGDLVQSMLKRSLNVKDSGKLMPGHGGVLDRFDGLIICAPFVYAWIIFFTNL